jgi:hypothetical protein
MLNIILAARWRWVEDLFGMKTTNLISQEFAVP